MNSYELQPLQIILKINSKVQTLTQEEREEIKDIIIAHSCEPMEVAERIGELLGVDHQAIFDLL